MQQTSKFNSTDRDELQADLQGLTVDDQFEVDGLKKFEIL